jgi:hypothetical protein
VLGDDLSLALTPDANELHRVGEILRRMPRKPATGWGLHRGVVASE